jgi:hypothetical protein
MSVTRSTLTGGPAYASLNSLSIQFAEDSTIETNLVTEVVSTSLYGEVDEIWKDMIVRCVGRPLFYDTAQLTTLFPYLYGDNPWLASGGAAIGAVYPGSSDLTCAWKSNNGDVVTLTSALIGKMPELELGVDGPILGPLEIWGIIGNTDDPSTEYSQYKLQSAQSYSAPAVPATAVLGRQEFTAAWGGLSGFSSFQAQEKWIISHELKLEPIVIQGRTRALRLTSYRAMAKCKPLGPTMANIDAVLAQQNTGNSAALGGRLISYDPTASALFPNLVITGAATGNTWTIGQAALKTAGYVFGGKPLRLGELGWISTFPPGSQYVSSGGNSPALALT